MKFEERIPYYAVKKNGCGYWQPTKKMRELGFTQVACGPDGQDARSVARKYASEWADCREESRKLSSQVEELAKPRQTEFPIDRGYVYFFKVGEFVKIGFSKSPLHRVQDLHVGQSAAADMMLAVKGTRADEKRLHKALENFRRHGEWFKASASVMATIAGLFMAGRFVESAIKTATKLERNSEKYPAYPKQLSHNGLSKILQVIDMPMESAGERDGT